MILAASLAALAIVTQNQAPLRSAPHDAAPSQAMLWQGDAVEIRGAKLDYLQVFDPRHKRDGYLKATQIRELSLKPEEAPDLLAVVRFLRDTPGSEALGIGYAEAYLKAVPAESLTAEPFDALGVMAERLAQRVSANRVKANESALAGQVAVADEYGVHMKRLERDGAVQLCYDGEAFRRVLAMAAATPVERARAALGLTRHECVDPGLGPSDRYEADRVRAEVLDRVPADGLEPGLLNAVRLRRAGIWAGLAFAQVKRGEVPRGAADRAIQEFAAVNRADLADSDIADYTEAAVRVGASRWGAETMPASTGKVTASVVSGVPGETCVILKDAKHDLRNPLAQRCTFGDVWLASAQSNWSGTLLAISVQTVATWRELWIFRATPEGWVVSVLPPATGSAGIGYVEFAGWVPGSKRMLIARETQIGGQFRRRFEVVRVDTLATEKAAAEPELLPTFARWQNSTWKRTAVAMR